MFLAKYLNIWWKKYFLFSNTLKCLKMYLNYWFNFYFITLPNIAIIYDGYSKHQKFISTTLENLLKLRIRNLEIENRLIEREKNITQHYQLILILWRWFFFLSYAYNETEMKMRFNLLLLMILILICLSLVFKPNKSKVILSRNGRLSLNCWL